MIDYWQESLKDELSQGDLISGLWVGTSQHPRSAIKKAGTHKDGAQLWSALASWKPDNEGLGNFVARGREVSCIVISQDCEIDKQDGKVPVLVAPVFSLKPHKQETQELIRARRRYAYLPLPACAELGDESYVDLRVITYLPRPVVNDGKRLKSASATGVEELVKQLVAFFAHVDIDKLVIPAGSARDEG